MTRSALSNIAYEALVRARRKFSNREERCIRETWTAEQELVLLRLYPDMPNEVLAARLNKTLQQICSKAYRLGLKKSPEFSKKIRQDWDSATRFKKGNTPWNCGMKGLPARGRSSETQFKKGQKPHTWLPVGSTRVSADGYPSGEPCISYCALLPRSARCGRTPSLYRNTAPWLKPIGFRSALSAAMSN
ncbi:hypothetical protein [Pseudomonas aeruginosa]|uniref:hypothetical protein n=1 Tax=Pseudomonas aeruginosa TaxID=287 RepID=UPI001F4144CD|nr:hypothetical protein [Pseudomonas aeruginosa]